MNPQEVQAHFTYSLANAVVRQWPFPHFFYENVFPADFYSKLVKSIPKPPDYDPISKVRPVISTNGTEPFPDRFVIPMDGAMKSYSPYWDTARDVILSQQTHLTLLGKFSSVVEPRIGDTNVLEPDSILIRDRTNYALNPHTDNPRRLAVLLIYLPKTSRNPHLGTSLYTPNDPRFRCPGTAHHPRENFSRVFTAPYIPNSALAFAKTDNSFHGVEPVLKGEERNLIHFFSRLADD